MNESINQSIKQRINEFKNQSMNQWKSTNQSIKGQIQQTLDESLYKIWISAKTWHPICIKAFCSSARKIFHRCLTQCDRSIINVTILGYSKCDSLIMGGSLKIPQII